MLQNRLRGTTTHDMLSSIFVWICAFFVCVCVCPTGWCISNRVSPYYLCGNTCVCERKIGSVFVEMKNTKKKANKRNSGVD